MLQSVLFCPYKKSLKIPKGQSESVNRRKTDNTMAIWSISELSFPVSKNYVISKSLVLPLTSNPWWLYGSKTDSIILSRVEVSGPIKLVYPLRIFIKVPVPNRDIEWSSIFVLRVSILLLDFGADSTVRYYLFFILLLNLIW
jgi:hypothetical protein